MIKNINDKVSSLEKLIGWFVDNSAPTIASYVDKLKQQNEGISLDNLAKKIVKRKAFKNGLVGGVTSLPGFLAMPITVPADMLASWRIQITLIMAIAYVYGHTTSTTDLKTDILLVMAGDSLKDVFKHFGIELTKSITKKTVDKYLTREIMVKMWKIIGQKIITKAGEKSLTSFSKMIFLLGLPVGFTFDWTATTIVGKVAIKYYSGKG